MSDHLNLKDERIEELEQALVMARAACDRRFEYLKAIAEALCPDQERRGITYRSEALADRARDVRGERDAAVARGERLEKAIEAAHERCCRALSDPPPDTATLVEVATILEAAMERKACRFRLTLRRGSGTISLSAEFRRGLLPRGSRHGKRGTTEPVLTSPAPPRPK